MSTRVYGVAVDLSNLSLALAPLTYMSMSWSSALPRLPRCLSSAVCWDSIIWSTWAVVLTCLSPTIRLIALMPGASTAANRAG